MRKRNRGWLLLFWVKQLEGDEVDLYWDGEDNWLTGLVLYILSFRCLLDIPMEMFSWQIREILMVRDIWVLHPTNPITHLLYLNPWDWIRSTRSRWEIKKEKEEPNFRTFNLQGGSADTQMEDKSQKRVEYWKPNRKSYLSFFPIVFCS